jgi:hypothetical protein
MQPNAVLFDKNFIVVKSRCYMDLPTSKWSLYQIQGTSSLRSKWNLPLRSPRNWTPLWRKWNSRQEKYEEAMKTIWKLKHHYPQGMETLSNEETEEFTLASPPRKMVTHAPPVYIIPNNDDDFELLLLVRSPLV